MAKKVYIGAENFAKRNLPSGYTQLEYIESSGTQYINTALSPSNDLEVEITLLPVSGATSEHAIFGSAWSISGYFLMFYQSMVRWHSKGVNVDVSGIDLTKKITIKASPTRLVVNDRTYNVSGTGTDSTNNIWLFATADNYAAGNKGQYKLYGCKIRKNGSLVRDYVPCKNSSGTVGLYDTINNTFNSGTGTFVAGNGYKTDVACAVNKIYLGIDNMVRRVKKAYIGIGGLARPFYGGGKLSYYGAVTPLTNSCRDRAATSIGEYALFAGGYQGNSNYYATVDTYNKSLTKGTAPSLYYGKGRLAATTVGLYALFAGGIYISGVSYIVDAYDTSLTRKLASSLTVARSRLASTTIGNYALFGGAAESGSGYKSAVDAYNTSLTKSIPTQFSAERDTPAATTVGNYALFAGGQFSSVVDAYDTSLTRTTTSAGLSSIKSYPAATTVGNYALFAGGFNGSAFDTVDAYDKSLTRTSPTSLSLARYQFAATSLEDYAIFGGGNKYTGMVTTVDAYDTSLTRTTPTPLSQFQDQLTATTIGNYALIGGGFGGNCNVVDAYTIV